MLRHYRLQIVLRAAGLVATALVLAYLVWATERFYAPAAVGVLLVVQVVGLVQYTEKTARDVTRFLAGIRAGDFATAPAAEGRGPVFETLTTAFEDVSAAFRQVRAEREEHLRYVETVVHHVGVALVAYRPDGRITLLNAAARRLLGVGALHDVHDLGVLSPRLVEVLHGLDAGGEAVVRVERDDEDLHLALHAARFRLRGETHTLASLQNIGDALAEKEMEAWQELTRVLTHEIMNSAAPIASLAATARTLVRPADATSGTDATADVDEALDAIERRSHALVHFADAYRSFSHLPKPHFAVVEVAPLLRRVHRLLRHEAEARGAALQVDVTPEDLQVHADEALVEQVLINLLLNAFDAVGGRPAAAVTLTAGVDRAARAFVRVADNGAGIAPALQTRVWTPFFTTKAGGSGIGLSLSRQIMRLHGGTLTLRSEPGHGAVFTLRF